MERGDDTAQLGESSKVRGTNEISNLISTPGDPRTMENRRQVRRLKSAKWSQKAGSSLARWLSVLGKSLRCTIKTALVSNEKMKAFVVYC